MKENLIDINRLKRFKVKLDNRYPILEDGIIPEKYMPSYVDDVLEFDTLSSFPTTGESGKIYLTADTNKSYRWTGSGYAEISSSLALGETSATAYRGDRGKIAYDHSQKSHSLTIAGNSVSALGGTLTKDTLLTSLGLSSAASDITSLKAHVANGDIHVTADDKTTWNSAVDTLDTHTKDTTIHITSDERTKWNNNISNLSTHIADSTKHITASERTAWNAKWDYNEATIKAVKVNNATTADKVGHTLTFADGTTFNGSADKSIGKAQVGLDKVENKTITVTSSSVSDGTNTFNKYTHPTHSAVTIASADGRVLGSISVDSLGHVTSVGYKALGFADIPSLYIGKTKVQSSAKAQALTGISSITLEGSTAELKWDDDKSAWRLSGNLLVDGFVASGGTGSSGGSSGGAVDVSYVANLTAGTLLGTLTINGTDYQILAPSLTASSINAALGNIPVARATSDAEGNSISGTYAKTSSLPTKVSQLTNDSGYLTGITKAMVESVLTGGITSHTHTFASLTSKPTTLSGYGITNGLSFLNDNENYLAARFIGNAEFAKKAASKYIELWQGGAGFFNLLAGKYIVSGGTSAHFLKGDGSLDSTAYLPLSGGTISSSSSTPININSTGAESGIRFYLNNTAKGGIWYNPNLGTCLYTYADSTGDEKNHSLGIRKDGNGYIDTNTILHSGNIGKYKAGDSDKLDGYHRDEILRRKYGSTSVISLNDVVTPGIDFTSWSFADYGNINNQPYGDGAASAASVVSFGTDYPFQIYSDYSNTNKLFYRSYYSGNGWKDWRQFAFLDSNVASATQLRTARTIWGKSFDGTKDVSGGMSQVTSIEMSGTSSTSGHGGFIDFHYNGSTSDYTSRIIEDASGRLSLNSCLYVANGNVGIGTNQPSYKLHVNGSLRASSLTLNGSNLLEWDSDNSAWKFNGNLIATGFIASGDISAQAAALAEEEDRIAALEAQVAELQAEIETLKTS